jgi:hypothetical protein
VPLKMGQLSRYTPAEHWSQTIRRASLQDERGSQTQSYQTTRGRSIVGTLGRCICEDSGTDYDRRAHRSNTHSCFRGTTSTWTARPSHVQLAPEIGPANCQDCPSHVRETLDLSKTASSRQSPFGRQRAFRLAGGLPDAIETLKRNGLVNWCFEPKQYGKTLANLTT